MRPKLVLRWLGLAVSIACLVFFLHAARDALAAGGAPVGAWPGWRWVPVAMVPYLVAYAALAFAWRCMLRLLGMQPGTRAVLRIYLSAQIAKYFPGNVGQHVGRVYLASREGLPAFLVGISLAMEMLLVLACAVLLSLPLAPVLAATFANAHFGELGLGAAVALLVAVASIYLLRQHSLVKSAAHQLRSVISSIHAGSVAPFAGATGLTLVGLILAGSALMVLCGATTPGQFVQGVALVCVAWVAGFLTPGAPAGLGVREAILLAGLGSLFDQHVAVQATILFRVVSVAADLVALLTGLMLRNGRQN